MSDLAEAETNTCRCDFTATHRFWQSNKAVTPRAGERHEGDAALLLGFLIDGNAIGDRMEQVELPSRIRAVRFANDNHYGVSILTLDAMHRLRKEIPFRWREDLLGGDTLMIGARL